MPTASNSHRDLTAGVFREAMSAGDPGPMLALFSQPENHESLEGQLLAAAYESLARRAIRDGENFLAHDLSTRGEALAEDVGFPRLQLKQLQALALARGGAPHRARQMLQELTAAGASDADTVGLLARTYRDFALSASEPQRRQAYFHEAFALARRGFESNQSYYNGIQAAQFALLSGEQAEAVRYADQVEKLCLAARANCPSDTERFWIEETLAESLLIRGRLDEARAAFRDGLSLGEDRPADVGAILRVCRMLLEVVSGDPHAFDADFYPLIPPIVAFSGHMIDGPGRDRPRLPESKTWAAREAIQDMILSLNPRGGFCQGASGGDLIFAEALLESGREVYLVLPFDVDATRALSVKPAGEAWLNRFDRVLSEAHTVKELRLSAKTASSADFAFANTVMTGLAILKARHLESRVLPVALWDGVESGEVGGTWDFIHYWRKRGEQPVTITIGDL